MNKSKFFEDEIIMTFKLVLEELRVVCGLW